MQIFLAAPFTQMLDSDGAFEPRFRGELAQLQIYLEELGHDVFSAHSREKWGEALDTPGGALAIDLAQIDRCDALVAVIGNPPSPGVQLELGYAIAMKKPLVLVADPLGDQPYLVDGIPPLTSATLIRVTNLAESYDALRKALRPLGGGTHADERRERSRSTSRRGRAHSS